MSTLFRLAQRKFRLDKKEWLLWAALWVAFGLLIAATLFILGTRGLILMALAAAFFGVGVVVLQFQPFSVAALAGLFFAVIILLPSRFHILVQFKFLSCTYGVTHLLLLALILTLGLLLILQGLNRSCILASKLDLLLLGLVWISLLSFLANSGDSSYGIGRYVLAFILFFGPMTVFFLLIRADLGPREFDFLINLLILLAFVVSLLGIFVSAFALRYLDFLGWERVTGVISTDLVRARTPVGGAGSTSIFIGMMLPLVVARMIYTPHRLRRLMYVVVLLTGLTGMLLAQSRAPLLSVILAGFFFFLPSLRTRSRVTWLLVFLTVVIVVTSLTAKEFDLSALVSLQVRQVSDSVRYATIMTGLEVFADYPLFGTGMGRIYPRPEPDVPMDLLYYKGRVTLRDPHSQYVMFLAELGIAGLSLLLVFVGVVGYTVIVNLGKIKDEKQYFLARAFAASVLAYMVYSLFSSSMSVVPKVAVVFWFVAGLGWNYMRTLLVCQKEGG
jgi:O-antigen ligase